MAVTRLLYQLQAGVNKIDLARDLSLALRTTKIHQKQIFTVVGGMVIDNPETNQAIEIATAPNTWYVKEAVNRGFNEWKKYRHRTLKEANVVPSEFADFKLQLNSVSGQQSIRAINFDRDELSLSEWSNSVLENDAGTAKTFTIMGDHTPTKYGLMLGWLQTKNLPQLSEPNMNIDLDGDGTYDYRTDFLVTLDGTNDNISEQVIDVVEENDERCYPLDTVYGDIFNAQNLQSQAFVYVSANNPHQMIPGFKAVCGLLQVNAGSGTSGPLLYLDVLNTPEAF